MKKAVFRKLTQSNFLVKTFIFLIVVGGLIYFAFYFQEEKIKTKEIPSQMREIEEVPFLVFEEPFFTQAEREIFLYSQPKELREKLEKFKKLEDERRAATKESERRKITAELIALKKEIISLLEKEKKMSPGNVIDFSAGPEGFFEKEITSLPQIQPYPNLQPGSEVERSSAIGGFDQELNYSPVEQTKQDLPSAKDYLSLFPN